MSEPAHVVALDLGGTDLKFARVGKGGEVRDWGRVPSHPGRGADALLDVLAGAALSLAGGAGAVGLGCPGVVDPRTGALVDVTPHIAFPPDFPVAERLAERIGLPVHADNDANLAALAESRWGAARDTDNSVTFTIGTGVGCGIVCDGRLVRGVRGGAGEISHAALGGGGPRCECGVPGCLEPLSGGGGLVRRALEAGLAAKGARDVFALAQAGDETAAGLVVDMADALGRQIAVVLHVVNPAIVVVGGGVAGAGEAWLGLVREAVSRYAMTSHTRGLRIVPAALGERAGVIGAGALAWDRVNGAGA